MGIIMDAKNNICIILGNGFSIDLMHKIDKHNDIDLSNLFRLGDKVHWPVTNMPGFLSFQHCPALWTLGARPNSSSEVCSKVLDDVITCANFHSISNSTGYSEDNCYNKAYYELVVYLRYLFIYYNDLVDDKELDDIINEWGWSLFFSSLNSNMDISTVTIITYNYDLFLERILKLLHIDYQLIGFDSTPQKFRIIKPHGSISFTSKVPFPRLGLPFNISYGGDNMGGSIDDYIIDEIVESDKLTCLYAMIPPYGEAARYSVNGTETSKPDDWASFLRIEACEQISKLTSSDSVFIGGLSYCNVDRSEIDLLLKNIKIGTKIYNVNPNCTSTLSAVISSTFSNYTHFATSDTLGEIKL